MGAHEFKSSIKEKPVSSKHNRGTVATIKTLNSPTMCLTKIHR